MYIIIPFFSMILNQFYKEINCSEMFNIQGNIILLNVISGDREMSKIFPLLNDDNVF